MSSQEEKQPCGNNYIGGEGNLAWINPKSRAVFGVDATRVYTQNVNGPVEIVETTREKTDYVTSPEHEARHRGGRLELDPAGMLAARVLAAAIGMSDRAIRLLRARRSGDGADNAPVDSQ